MSVVIIAKNIFHVTSIKQKFSPTLLNIARTATGMDGTLPKCQFENLKPVLRDIKKSF